MVQHHIKIYRKGVLINDQYVDGVTDALTYATRVGAPSDKILIWEAYRCADKFEDHLLLYAYTLDTEDVVQDIL